MKKIVVLLNVLLISLLSFSANQEQTNLDAGTYIIGATNATVNLNITESQTITVFKDTLLFEENFNNFLREGIIGTSTIIGGENILTILPNSMTQMPGCKARNIKINSSNECNLQNTTSKFRTPIINVPENSQLFFSVKNTNSITTMTINNTTVSLNSNFNSTKIISLSSCSYVEFGKNNNNNKTLLIDNIKITAPREVIPHVLNNNAINLQGLTPNTKYYIEVCNSDLSVANTYYFTTPKQIESFSSDVINSEMVSLSWTNNENTQALTFSFDSISNPVEDLLFTKIATTSNVNLVEIYNSTERDICLKDYEFVAYNNSTTLSPIPLRYSFLEKDSIKSNSCIIIASNMKASPYDTNIVVYSCQPNNGFAAGNDSYLLLKEVENNVYDTIDLFGVLMAVPDNYSSKILIRNSNIRQGIKHNPDNVANVYDEWTICEYDTSVLNPILGTHVMDLPIGRHNKSQTNMTIGQESIQLTDVHFNGVYRCDIKSGNQLLSSSTFKMGKEIKAVRDGDWNDENVWENNLIPSRLDKVILDYGTKINIPQNVTAECAELVLKSDYSTQDTSSKAEIRCNGNITIAKTIVKSYFSAYTSQQNGWTLFGLPINISNKSQEEIANNFSIGVNDDLFSLKEDYTSMASAWFPYASDVSNENFFKQNLGYLIAYSQDKELNWEGDLFLEDELELLNNASYSPQGGNGYHLCANPYPFSVKYSNFSTNNIAGMWLLVPSTGQYVVYNPNEPSDFMIPPAGGFMTKVESNTNLLKIHKNGLLNQAKNLTIFEKLHLNLSYEGGEDDLKIYFREGVTENIDEYDVYKLFSFGSAPDLYCNFSQNNLSIVSLPLWEDSVCIPLICNAKNQSTYELTMKNIPENVLRAELYENNSNNELLIDFVIDSTYSISLQGDSQAKSFILKLYSFDSSLEIETENHDFKIIQEKNKIIVLSSNKIEELSLYDVKGIKVVDSKTNEIIMPKKACYVLSLRIEGKNYSRKIIYL